MQYRTQKQDQGACVRGSTARAPPLRDQCNVAKGERKGKGVRLAPFSVAKVKRHAGAFRLFKKPLLHGSRGGRELQIQDLEPSQQLSQLDEDFSHLAQPRTDWRDQANMIGLQGHLCSRSTSTMRLQAKAIFAESKTALLLTEAQATSISMSAAR